jgi:hypothetical protein
VDTHLSSTEVHTIGSSGWKTGEPLPRAMWGMASVSLDQEVIFIGKTDNIVFIIQRIAGGHGGGQQRREILSYKGGNWTEVGRLGKARSRAAATKIMVNSTVCN